MICAPIDTEAPRFHVASVSGYRITPGSLGGSQTPVTSVVVIDGYYQRDMAVFASDDAWTNGRWVPNPGKGYTRRRGHEGALAAVGVYCAELNAWHEREGWGE